MIFQGKKGIMKEPEVLAFLQVMSRWQKIFLDDQKIVEGSAYDLAIECFLNDLEIVNSGETKEIKKMMEYVR